MHRTRRRYPRDNKLFLRRIVQPDIKLSDFYIGNTINVLSRRLYIVGFANDRTERELAGNSEKYQKLSKNLTSRCICIITPSGTSNAGKYISNFERSDFKIIKLKMLYMNSMDVRKYFNEFIDCVDIVKLANSLPEGGFLALELMRRDAHSVLKNMLYGSNIDKINIFANSDVFMPTQDPKSSENFSKIIFSIQANTLNKKYLDVKDSTCAVIKPHAVHNGLIGEIWENIQSGGFQIIAVRNVNLSKADASEFLEVYKGVLNEYPKLIYEFTNGTCVALIITRCDACHAPEDPESVQQRFREFVGPMDPEIARCLKPNSIRAKYGVNLVENAIHCTDLPDDIDFLFRILSG
ncbi:unnamed protein product [Hymenolepis diminuta]|uniref:DM10 domain-containing protein n=1 Tax=Hymenolepis diminuta TaxID=6216 RepID=A0A0R3SR64_HYMDI|nr:unnamed protein product [Hymenolepis diminuta]